jgi:nicotinamidase-related amidase
MKKNPRITSKDSVLLVIDVQDKLLAAMPKASDLLRDVGFLLDVARLLEVPILATEQYPQGLGATHPTLAVRIASPISAKTQFSCCGPGEFLPTLNHFGRPKVIVTGMESHVCVLQTVLDLIDRDYSVFVPVDGVQSRFSVDHEVALRRLESAGATLTSVETTAFEWLEDAKHPQFKAVSKLVRERMK